MKPILTLIAFLLSFGIPRPAFPAQPNIVFVLANDIGINGLGCYGSDRFQGR